MLIFLINLLSGLNSKLYILYNNYNLLLPVSLVITIIIIIIIIKVNYNYQKNYPRIL